MNQEEIEMLEELNGILTAVTISSNETKEKATEIIQKWIDNTDGIKGYCRI